MSALDDIREIRAYQRGLPLSADQRMVIQGQFVEIDNNRAIVAVDGSPGIPMIGDLTSVYTEGAVVNVLRNPFGGGDQYVLLGPTGGTTAELPDIPDDAPDTITAVATIRPNWTGTWDANSSRYDNWNVARTAYGGRATLYQGDKYGSGPLVGLAVYGNQIKDLDAISIETIKVTLRGAGLNEPAYPAIELRAATNSAASGAPAPTGAVVTGAPGKSGVVSVNLDASVLEGFRTGTYKSIALAGTGYAEYAAVRGTSDADGMALTVKYTRPV